MTRALVALLVALLLTGCGTTARSGYRPTRTVPGELTLRYDDGFEVWNGAKQLSVGPRYEDLPTFVRCVPRAKEHADAAQAWGYTNSVLTGLTYGTAVAGMASLGGLYLKDKNDDAMAVILLTGLALEAAAIFFGATVSAARTQAHGHALDAVAYYNDEVGFAGGSCPAR